MILFQEVHKRILSALDAENTDKYTPDQDTIPAVNGAMEILVTWFNQAFAEKKLVPENLRELTKVKVWKVNSYSRFSFNPTAVGHSLWTTFAIYPKPIVTSKSIPVSSEKNNSESKYLPNVSFVKSSQSAKRLTFEEWNENEFNAFMPGNAILKGSIAEYAYLDPADYSSTGYTGNSDKSEWTIRPEIPNEMVAMAYLKYPTQVRTINDSIEFPESLTDLITELCLNKIAYKQPTQSLFSATEQNVNKLVALIRNG